MRKILKKILPNTVVMFIYKQLKAVGIKGKLQDSYFANKSAKDVFTIIYNRNHWNEKESVSGAGSALSQTKIIINEIDSLIKKLNIKTVLDLPCGDFNWMRFVDLKNVDYVGADIVKELIASNSKRYQTNNIQFKTIDLISDQLSCYDLIINRDCFVHLSFDDILKCIQNIKQSKSKYLLTTTFTNRQLNEDITTGSWRTLNLQINPFRFPEPKIIINENCSEQDYKYIDKSLALYLIEDIKNPIT